MGWADKLAGGALGIAAGAVISAGVIMGMANLTYGSEVADEIATKVLNSTLDTDRAKARLEEGLTHSAIVDTFLDVVDVVSSSTPWFVPNNFRSALDILSQRQAAVDPAISTTLFHFWTASAPVVQSQVVNFHRRPHNDRVHLISY